MRSALSALEAGIADLRWFISSIEMEWSLLAAASENPPCSLADELATKLKQHIGRGVAKRRFDYSSLIVSLYGLLEQYIESMIRGYSANLNYIIPRYENLPKLIIDNHKTLSIDLFSKALRSRYRGVDSAEKIIENLHTCLSNKADYRINTDALCLHSANFRTESIDEVFGRIGVKGIASRLHLFSPFGEYLTRVFPERQIEKLRPEEKFRLLDDLAERRNEVAHGNISEILNNELITEYIDFVESYCISLFELVQSHYFEHVAQHIAKPLGKPIVIHNNTIVCISVTDMRIAVGDTLIAATGKVNMPYLAGEILEIQVDKVPVEVVQSAESTDVGISVKFRSKKSYDFFLLPRNA